jgi:mannose-6-phosphate isomerase-like protein (cupin superfamily)
MRLLLPSLMLTGTLAFAQQAPPAQQKPQPSTQKPAVPAAPPSTQKPAAPTAAPPTAKPAPAATAPRRPAAVATTRAGMAITVTDMRGRTIPGVHVEASGPTARMGETDSSGQLNFPGLAAGTYRLRFSGEPVTAFEKEVTVRSGQIADVDVSLSAAPPKPEPPAAAAPVVASAPPPPPPLGPSGQAQALSLYDLAERELRARQPRSEVLVSCSGNSRSTVIFITNQEPWQRMYEGAEVSYYVLGGEATIKVDGKDTTLAAGGYAAIPRGVAFAITRRGRNALSMLSVLSGAPCEEAK